MITSTLTTRVLLADDHCMVRQGLAEILGHDERLVVVGQVGSGPEAIELAAQLQPDVLVVDYSMPGMDGAEVARQMVQQHPDIGVLLLSIHENVHYAVNALQAGAMAYVVKSDTAEELVEAIRQVASGRNYVSSRLSSAVAQHLSTPHRQRGSLDQLSPREFELLRWLARGQPLKECAKMMNISESTASTYRQRVVGKLGLDSTAGLIRFALEHGIDG